MVVIVNEEAIRYGRCLVRLLYPKDGGCDRDEEEEVVARCWVDLETGALVLSSDEVGNEKDGGVIRLRHKKTCPAMGYEDRMVVPPPGKRLRTGIAVVVENELGRIMLTRRSKNLKSFPDMFVFPGGNRDDEEDLFETGKREVLEEVGLDISQDEIEFHCAWESTWPLLFSEEEHGITHHHFVLYLYVRTNTKGKYDRLAIQASEVSEVVWVDKTQARLILEMSKEFDKTRIKPHSPVTIESYSLGTEANKHLNWTHNLPANQKNTLPIDEVALNVTYGTQFALQTWINNNHPQSANL